jgi:hypothetical protein
MTSRRASAALLVLALAASAPALAQSARTRNVEVKPGQETRLAVAPNLKKDCKQGAPGEIRVVTGPKNGSLVSKGGKLRTPTSYRCPNIEALVQTLFYKPNDKYTGPDEVVIETKLPDAPAETVTIKINVTDKAKGQVDL